MLGPNRVDKYELERIRRNSASNALQKTSADMRYQQRVTNERLAVGTGFAESADVIFGEDLSLEDKMLRARNRLGSVNTGLVL